MSVLRSTWIPVLCLLGACTYQPLPEVASTPPPAADRLDKLQVLPSPTPTDTPAPIPSSAHPDQVTLIGMVTLPRTVTGLANAKDGVVVGTPVEALDVLTGQRVGIGNTFYDGSYAVKVPAAAKGRPMFLRVQLVDTTNKPVCPLFAPAVLGSDDQQTQDVGAGSTAYVALLYLLAAKQSGQPGPDWTTLAPGISSRPFAEMVLGSKDGAPATFATFAESAGQLGQPTSGPDLKAAIDGLVTRLAGSAKIAT